MVQLVTNFPKKKLAMKRLSHVTTASSGDERCKRDDEHRREVLEKGSDGLQATRVEW